VLVTLSVCVVVVVCVVVWVLVTVIGGAVTVFVVVSVVD